MLALLLALSCTPTDTGRVRGPGEDSDTGPRRDLVAVSHDRELRGVWVASVSNINFPSRTGLSADEQKAELRGLLDTMEAARLNAIFFQVRPESDALYASDLEPWSRFLSGTQGEDPGYDPLATLLDEAHARGIEVHAWFNPYRAKVSSSSAAVAPHPSVTMAEHAHVYGSYLWMDPGAEEVQDHVVDVILDVVRRYDVDGVHFDDYFYPYPDGTEFPDDATYADYVAAGGDLGRDDWRRDNVNRLMERLDAEIRAEKPHVRFGISPFGIYRPGQPEGITGLDQYAEIFADPVKWKQEGWVDYLAPQLYWPSTQTAQAYGPLIDWWAALPEDGRYTFAGTFLSKLGTSSAWTVDELRTQIALSRAEADHGSLGNIHFQIAPLQSNQDGITDAFAELYAVPALTPPVVAVRSEVFPPPDVVVGGSTATVSHASDAFAWVVYHDAGDAYLIDRIVPAGTATIELASGRWAISAASRGMVESQGVVVVVP